MTVRMTLGSEVPKWSARIALEPFVAVLLARPALVGASELESVTKRRELEV